MKAIEIANLFGSTINLVSVLTTDDEFIVNKLKSQLCEAFSVNYKASELILHLLL